MTSAGVTVVGSVTPSADTNIDASHASGDEVYDVMIAVASGSLSVEEIACRLGSIVIS